jgi:hypothetical protein
VRHAVAKSLLAATVALPALVRALVLPASHSIASRVAQPAAFVPAVALPPVVPETDMECVSALEANDLDEIDQVGARHAAGKARLDKGRCEWDALYVTR